jgi:hypothetical protein
MVSTSFAVRSGIVAVAALAFAGTAADEAAALAIGVTSNASTLAGAVQSGASGISVVGGSEALQGSTNQQGTFTGFSLAPSSGSTPTLNLPDGIVLSSGNANVNMTNTVNETTVNTGSGSNAMLTALAGGTSTFNANVLEFDFTVSGGNNAVTATFVFGTEEFTTQTVTDIFGFFVDGVNYAKFPNGDLISNTPGNPTNFIDNPVGAGLYDIEYNGLTRVLTVTGLLDMNPSTHSIKIGIADTFDTRFDSGVYIGGLHATATGGDGGIDLPESSTVGLFGLGLAARRRKA